MEKLFITNWNIDDPYLAAKEFYNVAYSSGQFLNVIYTIAQNLAYSFEGASCYFHDEYDEPLNTFVNFTFGFNQHFEPAEDILVPVDVYKTLTLQAIDTYQQKHYHEGLANIRDKFLPNNEQSKAIFLSDRHNIDKNLLAYPVEVYLVETLFGKSYDRSDPYWALKYYLDAAYNIKQFIGAISCFIKKIGYGISVEYKPPIFSIEYADLNLSRSKDKVLLYIGSYLDYMITIPFSIFKAVLIEAVNIFQQKHHKKALAILKEKLENLTPETPHENPEYNEIKGSDDEYE
ncbi:hypothetical protein N5853_14040 (plasmid) [Bartonella sp. HY329]|uniref:hypothetical protein n=1 Tax=unclassified Bartonella TaxID=2645622 RepID=UPI0021C650F6|nr:MULTISPECIES: hypothetical protein [unclassified Bartonella]UXM96650.1 hypothetical protein N5853_14040 [Bartonella sp. HY329]UXN10973.1 hypothetical protein N5852_14045 [Bartonella sp. HY328]